MAAAAVGGMIASGIMKVVIKQIGSASMGKFKRHRSLTKDLEKMKMTLESLEAALSDAERRSITDSAALLWVNRLKDAMYEISDMLNEYESEDPNLVRTIGKRISMPNKIKKMQDCLQKITEDRKSYSLPPETCTYEMTLPDVRENAGSMIEAEIIGRIKEKSDFLAHLSECCTEGATYGPIWGFGGIGKSTFAKLLFNDSCFKEYSRVWIYVSQMFDLKKIGNTIISQLSEKQDQPLDDLHGISIRLQKLLVEKRNVLIVLDDLWENHPSQLAELKSMLKQGEGCKVIVIVTTRDEGIANEIGTAQPYNLPQLSDEMCWEIIRQKSKFDTRSDKERLEPIGREIAKKCKGVALGAQALGHMLKSKPFREWNWVSTNDIWSLSTSVGRLPRDEVLGSLLLSYNIMPPHLKLCFAYCGIFPKGSKMIKANLIHLWIALEFVEPSSTFSSWQLGEIYIMQLLKMSFLQHSKADTQLSFQDGCTLFVMHDLVHDLARSVMADEFNLVGPNCRYAWLTDHTKPLKSSITSPVKLRALHIVDHKDDEAVAEFRHDAFSPAKNARVLDLSCYHFKELPTSVGELKQLRYLGAPLIVDGTSLSRISMPRELNYLDLRNCANLQVFPESLCEMKSLMHLDLSSSMHLQELPHSFGKLKALIYLNLALCPYVKGIREALTELTKLQHLNLAFCRNVRGLQQIICNLTELRYLNLTECIPYIFDSPSTNEAEGFIRRICNLACMEELDLSFNPYPLVSIPDNVTILRKLVLVRCLRITSLPECVAKLDNQTLFGLLPRFDVFGVADGNKCTNNLGLLEHVNPDELNIGQLENVWSREEAASIKLSEKVNMRELTLRWSDLSVYALLDDIDILEELVPPSTLHAFAIQGYASRFFPDWLMSIGSYLPNVVRLQLVDLPYCNSLPPITQLPNLRYLTLKNMYSLEEWNTSPFSSGEAAVNELISCKLDQVNIHGCMKLRITPQLPRAASMSIIRESDNVLTSWAESVSQNGASPSSSAAGGPMNLLVEDTKVPLHQWRLLHHVPACSHLHIRSCSDLTSSREITGALQSFRSLKLDDLESDTLPDWLGELTSLEQLEIKYCLVEEGLPDSIRQLKQLESLTLNTCSGLRQLPLWLGELTSLRKLELANCGDIITLPKNIHELTNLQELVIEECSQLEPWCESEENKMWDKSLFIGHGG